MKKITVMSEMEENKRPGEVSPEGDDELESLNDEEKAAFDKIMAEIAAATGQDPQVSANNTDGPEKAPSDDTAIPIEMDSGDTADISEAQDEQNVSDQNQADPDEVSAQDEETQASLEAESASGSDSVDNESVAASEENTEQDDDALDTEQDDDALDEEQQAALDQIMAEIESRQSGNQDASDSEPAVDEPPEPADQESDQENDDALDEDQQAALDQIMAEIESKRKVDKDHSVSEPPAEETPKPVEQGDDDALDEDQQAALNQIMAEIESKRKGDSISTGNAGQTEEEPGADDTDDDEKAMEKIMAEIEAQKQGGREEDDGIVAEQNEDGTSENQELSMDEFDNELNNLLSSSQITSNQENTDEPDAAPNDNVDDVEENITDDSTSQTDDSVQEQNIEIPILQEVDNESSTEEPVETAKGNKIPAISVFLNRKAVRMTLFGLAYVPIFVIAVGISYWAYKNFTTPPPPSPGPSIQPEQHQASNDTDPAPSSTTEAPNSIAEPIQAHPAIVQPVTSPSPSAVFAQLKKNLIDARVQTQNKIADIRQLSSYYQRGVNEEYEKIEERLIDGSIPSFNKAMTDKKIELALRAIQRRQMYITKLETPTEQLTAISEELLFLERKTHTYEILNSGINGLPVAAFKDETMKVVESYVQYQADISVDNLDATPLSLTEIWTQVTAYLSKKANLLAQREPLNREISSEICRGNFDRKFQLTAVSEKTAQCLIKWAGKDLYLNAVTELTPEIAQILSQWQGEWLSLNGLRELSADTAKYLAQWPGKRLSLNGLTHLSQQTTAELSRWRGAQLEMVGLKSIGSWENYGTQLFLSEKLKQEIEEQVQ